MAESPYNRPVAADLIGITLEDHYKHMLQGYCGFTTEMTIYTVLKEAGYLTEEAMVETESGCRPSKWKELTLELKERLSAPTTLCVTELEKHNWNVDSAEKSLRIQGMGGRA